MSEPVFISDSEAPEMKAASEAARQSFKYFWRELSWDRRRIIPALSMQGVKCSFTDGPRTDGQPEYERMWIFELDFDGETVSGKLVNSPNWLSSIKLGDAVHVPFSEVSDWMITSGKRVLGGFTVNVLRANMDDQKRKEHDDAWGLTFGDPAITQTELYPTQGNGFQDHPMCGNSLRMIETQLKSDPSFITYVDHNGLTLLHSDALAGNFGVIKLLVQYGADIRVRTPSGRTASELARRIGWPEISDYLNQRDDGAI